MFYLIPSLSNPSIPLPSPAPFRFLLFFPKLRLAWKADNSIFDNTSSYSLPPFSLFFPLSPSLFFELVLVHGARRPLRGALEVFRDPSCHDFKRNNGGGGGRKELWHGYCFAKQKSWGGRWLFFV